MVKKLFALLRGIASENNWDFYYLNGFYGFPTKILINDLRVTSYELFLLHELRVTFCTRVTNYYLLNELQANFYIRVTS